MAITLATCMKRGGAGAGIGCLQIRNTAVSSPVKSRKINIKSVYLEIRTVLCKAVLTFSASWTPIGRTHLHGTYLPTATTYSISISSSVIPDTAREMLIYIHVYCYTSSHNTFNDLQLYVVQDGVTYTKYIAMYDYVSDYTVNSENMWFPVPTNRVLYFTVPSGFSNCYSDIYAIGYR